MTTITMRDASSATSAEAAGETGGRTHPTPARPDDDRFVALAAQVGAVAAEHSAEHDRDASFVGPAYEAMRATGYLRLAVPTELGGLGASARQICYAQAELARHDGAAALAVAMHTYNTLAQVYRMRKGAPDAEGVLRRVAGEDLIIATSGGSDWLWPTTVAEPDGPDAFRVSGRKSFCSQAPAATVITTSAVLGEPGPGAEVIHFAVPLSSDGVRLEETWDTLGMRGTASHDLVFDGVRVPRERVVGRRGWGEFGGPLFVAAIHFAPVVAATYFGIAAGARDTVVAQTTGSARGATPAGELVRVQRQVGLMDALLSTAWWGLTGALDQLGTDYTADGPTMATLMIAKRQAVMAAVEVVDLAMQVAGGRSYFRRYPLERAFRDVRAGLFHPLTPEITLTYAGKVALGGPLDTE
jgi:acyl-CoA dehydrogenase